METVVKFHVFGECIPQPRHRIGKRLGKYPQAYIPDEHAVHSYKAAVALAGKFATRGKVSSEPLAVSFLFALPRPKSYKKSAVFEWSPVKPDIDNLKKSALDALKGIVYTDDSQIVSARALKVTVPSDGKAALYVVFFRCGDAADEVTEFFDIYNRTEG